LAFGLSFQIAVEICKKTTSPLALHYETMLHFTSAFDSHSTSYVDSEARSLVLLFWCFHYRTSSPVVRLLIFSFLLLLGQHPLESKRKMV
jgi:hypothetical protein